MIRVVPNAAPPIPKKLHMIWIGDDSKRPEAAIASWRANHPDWQFILWGNHELDSLPWKARRQMDLFRASEHFEGVADLMRYEILHEHGGVYADANSISLRPLDGWLLETPLFAVWESERHRPGLIANTYIGAIPGHPALTRIIAATARMNKPVWRRAWPNPFRWKEVPPWKSVGPVFFTRMILPLCPSQATILPSVLFLPKHHCDTEQRDGGIVYASHDWHSTFKRLAETQG